MLEYNLLIFLDKKTELELYNPHCVNALFINMTDAPPVTVLRCW